MPGTRRSVAVGSVVALVFAGLLPRATAAGAGVSTQAAPGTVRAGVGVVDATWHVGASAGQYAGRIVDPETGEPDDEPAHNVDPYGHQTTRSPSYGIQSRNSVRALVVEGSDGARIALVKNDLYIPQDLLNTRVAQIVFEHELLSPAAEDTGINEANLTIGVSHNHSSPYYSSPSWGVMLFQDVFDIRFFEYMAERMARAVIEASANMVPVRMGASVVGYGATQRHSFGPSIADDGTPAGYPYRNNDNTITVLRFDDMTDPSDPAPLVNFVAFGQHPESLSGNNLITGDWIAPAERMADIDTGAVNHFMQNNTGTA